MPPRNPPLMRLLAWMQANAVLVDKASASGESTQVPAEAIGRHQSISQYDISAGGAALATTALAYAAGRLRSIHLLALAVQAMDTPHGQCPPLRSHRQAHLSPFATTTSPLPMDIPMPVCVQPRWAYAADPTRARQCALFLSGSIPRQPLDARACGLAGITRNTCGRCVPDTRRGCWLVVAHDRGRRPRRATNPVNRARHAARPAPDQSNSLFLICILLIFPLFIMPSVHAAARLSFGRSVARWAVSVAASLLRPCPDSHLSADSTTDFSSVVSPLCQYLVVSIPSWHWRPEKKRKADQPL
ncbi:hypothetical protein pclt_cds_734b [Pandoravirus celtis]|uniref:Uncharacterized protein n=1 Tax=Pandoravirus celtis TaxID=2568002 RepID=A0A4D6EHN6_9VIRU|nr:hypothetical protein pclt_cds_734b [Pandoravirus celtis]